MFKIPREKRSGAPKKNPTKKAFTLAEVMIVLTIIGILSAILLPSAIHSTPDKNILKFKKAHNTFSSIIRELISSGKYYTVGDFGRLPDGTLHDQTFDPEYHYFGKTMADIVSYKTFTTAQGGVTVFYPVSAVSARSTVLRDLKIKLDKNCNSSSLSSASASNFLYILTLPDDTVIYKPSMTELFASTGCLPGTSSPNCYDDPLDNTDDFVFKDDNDFDYAHYGICIDIDGIDGAKPFGYGVRRDGKIVSGARADWWLSRDITKKETDCCPKDLNDNGLCDDGDIVCE